MNLLKNKIKAFTIFEITIAISIMSVFIVIVTVALNRFNEQLKTSSEIHKELNDFYAVRSRIWQKLYLSDSIQVSENRVELFEQEKLTSFYMDDELLYYQTGETIIPLRIKTLKISNTKQEDNLDEVTFEFEWKNTTIKMSYLEANNKANEINNYFKSIE